MFCIPACGGKHTSFRKVAVLFEQIRDEAKQRDEAAKQSNNDVEVGELQWDLPDILGHFVAGRLAWQKSCGTAIVLR